MNLDDNPLSHWIYKKNATGVPGPTMSFSERIAMTSLIRNLEWKPSTVSWLSFVLMGLIVAGIGLSGTAHVVNYLQERLTEQGIRNNQEIAYALLDHVRPTLDAEPRNRINALNHAKIGRASCRERV